MAAVVDREQHQGALTPEAILKLYKTLASKILDVFDLSARQLVEWNWTWTRQRP